MASVTLLDGSTRDVALPVEVRRADAIVVSWVVDAGVAADVLAGHAPTVGALEPVPMLRGRTMVSMPFVRYLDGDLGAYNELGLAFVVRRPGDDEVASFIAHLPVDGAFTCAAGRQLWGFPKLVADELTIAHGPTGARVRLDTGEGSVVTAEVRPGRLPLPARTMRLTTYAAADGELRATPFTMRSAGLRARPGGTTITAEGDGPLAADLRALGLPGRRPVSTLWVSHLTGTFATAQPVGARAG